MQAAIDGLPAGSTIRIYAGTSGAITVTKKLTLIGAGDVSDPARITIVDAAMSGRVVPIHSGVTATLQGLCITRGLIGSGAGVDTIGALTMSNCTVSGNSAAASGGGIANSAGATVTSQMRYRAASDRLTPRSAPPWS